MSRFTGSIVAALRNLMGHPKKLVGSDLSGNLYYERIMRSKMIDLLHESSPLKKKTMIMIDYNQLYENTL